ncbi:MAG: CoA transferase subunit A [Chloroflexi bacterium]|nr:CoA transferase subunit A [Chloroflexota bacterium]
MHRIRKVSSKIMSEREAVETFVVDGIRLRSGGIGLRKPFALINETIRQRRKNITFILSGFTEDGDVMVGAGVASQLEGSYFGLEALGLAHNYRRAYEQGIPLKIKIEEYSNYGMTARFMAAAMGVPFMPVKSHLGSDLVRYHAFREKKAHLMEDPFSGEKVMLLPACPVDVAFVHAQRCDEDGNVQIWGPIGDDEWGARAAQQVVVEVEEIVDSEIVRRDPNRTILPSFMVSAIVIAPYGSHPYQCQGYYDLDLEYRKMYAEVTRTREGFERYLEDWVYGPGSHQGYLEKLGKDRLDRLRAKPYMSDPVNYGY